LVVAVFVTFVATVVQGTVGLGLGLLSVPILTLVDPVLTPVPQLIITVPLTLMMLNGESHAIEWPAVVRVSTARVVGIGAGIGLLTIADERLLDIMIGLAVLLAVAIISSGGTVRRHRTSQIVAGVISGTSGTISSIGGPPLALLFRRESGSFVRANLAAIYLIGLLMMIAARAISGYVAGKDVVIALWLAPAVFIGYLVARRF